MSDNKIDRRDVLIGSGITAALIGVNTASAQTATQSSSQFPQLDKLNLPTPIDSLDESTFVSEVQKLSKMSQPSPEKAEDTEIPFINAPIGTKYAEILKNIEKTPLVFSPFEIEYLFNALDDHINRCLQIREEARELEVESVNERLELLLDNDLNDISEALESVEESRRPNQITNLISPSFNPADNTIRGKADKEFFDALTAFSQSSNAARKNDLKRRIAYLEAPASGLNYVSRFKQLEDLFYLELEQAYRRAIAVSVGLEEIYEINAPVLPTVTDGGGNLDLEARKDFFDKLVLWVTDVRFKLERRLLKRSIKVIPIPLDGAGDKMGMPLAPGEFIEAIHTNKSAEFNIDEDTLSKLSSFDLKSPLLRGVAIGFFTDALGKTPSPAAYCRVKVELDERSVKYKGSDDANYSQKPQITVIPSTSIETENFIRIRQREVHNFSPFTNWKLTIDQFNIFGTDINAAASVGTKVVLYLIVSDEI